MAATLGVSYRPKQGPRGGKKKPVVVFKMESTVPGARISQMEALWHEQEYHEQHQTGATVWEWED